jgi:hypothetical protein
MNFIEKNYEALAWKKYKKFTLYSVYFSVKIQTMKSITSTLQLEKVSGIILVMITTAAWLKRREIN